MQTEENNLGNCKFNGIVYFYRLQLENNSVATHLQVKILSCIPPRTGKNFIPIHLQLENYSWKPFATQKTQLQQALFLPTCTSKIVNYNWEILTTSPIAFGKSE
jgi:hypothetical protein